MKDLTSNNKSTRDRVLETLLTHHSLTINEIAKYVGINPISVRHHINRLEADGLVTSSEERYGIGRPRRTYYLTENGHEQFPTNYLKLTIRLLEQLKDKASPALINNLFSGIAESMITEYESNIPNLTLEEKLDLISNLLTQEGFQVDWQKQGDNYFLNELNCPYLYIGRNHPEVCHVDQTLISSVLNIQAEKVKCMLDGDQFCTYIIPAIKTSEME